MFHGEQFRNDEPWSQMIKLLGLNCSREQFVGGLEAAGKANNCRVLIFIDALNEGEGNRLWSKFLPGYSQPYYDHNGWGYALVFVLPMWTI